MAQREIKDWITVNGKHIPIFDGESKQDAINRSIAKDNEDKKKSDIAKSQAERDKLNGKDTSKKDDKDDDIDDSIKKSLDKMGISTDQYKKEYIPLVKNYERLRDMYYDMDDKDPQYKAKVKAAMEKAEKRMNDWTKKATQSNKDKRPVKSEYEKYMTKYTVQEPAGHNTTYKVRIAKPDGSFEYESFSNGEAARNWAERKKKIATEMAIREWHRQND